jgi:L-ascorbate metabolism protein UlaG (beta-lactamase superfamily)
MYLLNPDLPVVKPGYKGNLWKNKQFDGGDYGSSQASFGQLIQWQLGRNPQQEEKKADKFRLKVHRNTSFITSDEDVIVWLGHASFFIRINGVSFLTDPCFKDLPMLKRMAALPCSIYDLIGIDYLLLSHGHRDHYDERSIKQILDQNPKMELLLPLRLSELLGKRRKQTKYQEAAWWQQYKIPHNDLEVTFLPAKHWNRRYLRDFNKQLWGSFMIQTPDFMIYFAADTAFTDHFCEIRQIMGAPDVCMLPVGAYKPSYIMKEAHMRPEEAVDAFHELGGQHMIPMHYGTYDLADEPLGEPARILHALDSQRKIQGKLTMLEIGKRLHITELNNKKLRESPSSL